VNANFTRSLDDTQKFGLRFIYGRNDFYSSGQVPLDLVNAGLLDRFGYVDPTDGGRVKLGTISGYYSKSFAGGDSLKVDGFLGRSLFDLYSNFTFYLHDPINGDAFQRTIRGFRRAATFNGYTSTGSGGSRRPSRRAATFTTTRSTSGSILATAARRPA
jgi:hypothetical protein